MRIDEVRENIYLLAIQMEESGEKEWAKVLYEARDYLIELQKIKEKKKWNTIHLLNYLN